MGWILRGSLHSETTTLSRYASPTCNADRFYRWLAVWHWLPITLTGAALLGGGTALGGWGLGLSWLLWGVFLRIAIGFHVSWLVNSATHLWGSRRFKTHAMTRRNNWWVKLLTWRGRLAQQSPCASRVCKPMAWPGGKWILITGASDRWRCSA